MLQYCYCTDRKKGKNNKVKPYNIKSCLNCHKKIEDVSKSYVSIVSKNTFWFCSQQCWKLYPKNLNTI